MKVTLGPKLLKIREERKLTQADFAEILGMSTSAYNRLERSETQADFQQLLRISEVLKVPVPELLPELMNFYTNNSSCQGGIVFGDFHYHTNSDEEFKRQQAENQLLRKELEDMKALLSTLLDKQKKDEKGK